MTRLERTYRDYNRRYFDDRLPDIPEVTVRWRRMKTLIAYQEGDEIAVNSKFRNWDSIWKSGLLHEMTHLDCPENVVHGKKFQEGMLRLAKIGAFRGIW